MINERDLEAIIFIGSIFLSCKVYEKIAFVLTSYLISISLLFLGKIVKFAQQSVKIDYLFMCIGNLIMHVISSRYQE